MAERLHVHAHAHVHVETCRGVPLGLDVSRLPPRNPNKRARRALWRTPSVSCISSSCSRTPWVLSGAPSITTCMMPLLRALRAASGTRAFCALLPPRRVLGRRRRAGRLCAHVTHAMRRPRLQRLDSENVRRWRIVQGGSVRREWATAPHDPQPHPMLSWLNTCHSQHELAVSLVTTREDSAFARVARGVKPFAKELVGPGEARRLCAAALARRPSLLTSRAFQLCAARGGGANGCYWAAAEEEDDEGGGVGSAVVAHHAAVAGCSASWEVAFDLDQVRLDGRSCSCDPCMLEAAAPYPGCGSVRPGCNPAHLRWRRTTRRS